MQWFRQRAYPRVTTVGTTLAMLALAVTGLLDLRHAEAAGLCATPGGSGAGGSLSGVINTYYPGVGTAIAGATSISVGAPSGAATPIAAGDMLLVIQMQAADFNSTNTNSYGHGPPPTTPASGYTALNASGQYEYVRATSGVVAGSVNVSGLGTGAGLLNSYTSAAATGTAGQRTFQVVRVPQYTTASTSGTLTAAAWNGSVGGVLALDTTSTLTLSGTVSLDGLGFRGAPGMQKGGAAGLSNTDVATSATLNANGNKGEGVAGTPLGTTAGNGYPGGDAARGAPANAGGGGTDGQPSSNAQNSGGGGGGNGGAGGLGGNSWSSNLPRGGYGGVTLPTTGSRAFLGGGGGAGSTNNSNNPSASGAAGGGIALVRAGAVAGAGTISTSGANAFNNTANDGGGGGGAGGTIVVTSPSGSLAGATLRADGGAGGNAWAGQAGAGNAHGPGGGGGGGWIVTSSAPTSTAVNGGANGITTTGNLAYGATPGSNGQTALAAPSTIPGVSGGAECADLSITKSAPATVVAGGAVAYTLNVANAGPAAADTVSVTDTLPANVQFVSASGTGWTCTNSGDISVTCTRASVASGGSAPAITVNVTAQPQAGTMTNTAAVTATTPDQNPANNTATANTTVTASADLAIVKTGPANVTAGGNISYSLTANNLGPSNASTVAVTDTLPAGVTFVSVTPSNGGWSCSDTGNVSVTCTRATWNAGASTIFTIVVTAPNQPSSLTNGASISSTTPDPVPANNTSSAMTTVAGSADLAVSKTGPANVTAGGNVSYTVDAENLGPSNASTVAVTDTLPAGITFVSVTPSNGGWSCSDTGNVSVTCTRATWNAGASTTFTIIVTAPNQAGSLTNTVAISSTTADPNPSNNTDTANTTVNASADLAVTKTGPATATAAGNISYNVAVSNLGPSDAANVSVLDTLPAGIAFVSVNASNGGWSCSNAGDVTVTCTRASWNAGASTTLTIVVTAPNQAASLTNTAAISSTTADPDPANNTDSTSTTVDPAADLAVTKSGPAHVTAGSNVSYTVNADSNGPSDAAGVSLTDNLPAGVAFVSVTPSNGGWSCSNAGDVSVTCTRASWNAGASTTFTIVVTAPNQAGSLTNTVSIASTTADPNPANNTDTANTTVGASADLAVTKTAPATVTAGGNISYTVDADNSGPSDATGVSLTDNLPAGVALVSVTPSNGGWSCSNAGDVSVTCTRASWTTGASTTFTIVVTAPNQPGSLTNTVSIASTTADPNPANNTDTVDTTVTGLVDLAIVKTGPASVDPGGAITYRLEVSNAGPSDAANVTVTDALPAGVTFQSAAGGGWSCSNAGDESVTCDRAALAAGATAPDLVLRVTAPTYAARLINTATVNSSSPDADPTNDTDSARTRVAASADLSVVKTGPAAVATGESFSYTISVRNAGPDAARRIVLTDILPSGVQFVSATGSGWTCSFDGQRTVTCERARIASGANAPDLAVVVRAPDNDAALVNSAEVAAGTFDPTDNNNSSTSATTVREPDDTSGGTLPDTGTFDPRLPILIGLGLIVVGAALPRRRLHRD